MQNHNTPSLRRTPTLLGKVLIFIAPNFVDRLDRLLVLKMFIAIQRRKLRMYKHKTDLASTLTASIAQMEEEYNNSKFWFQKKV